ncbi:MAG: hypothetical protein R6W90_01260 [Ignavibacteriaceae bacterium]
MKEIIELLEGFDFEADPGEAVLDLFIRVIACQATIASLKEMTLNNLSLYTNKSSEKLESEFQGIFDEIKNDLLVNFISKYGKVSR